MRACTFSDCNYEIIYNIFFPPFKFLPPIIPGARSKSIKFLKLSGFKIFSVPLAMNIKKSFLILWKNIVSITSIQNKSEINNVDASEKVEIDKDIDINDFSKKVDPRFSFLRNNMIKYDSGTPRKEILFFKSCNKYAYLSASSAYKSIKIMRQSLSRTGKTFRRKPVRAYRCNTCEYWHLTGIETSEIHSKKKFLNRI